MDLTPGQLGALAAAALAVAVVALALAGVALRRLARVRRDYRVLWADGEGDVARLAAEQHRRVVALTRELESVRTEVAAARADVTASLRHVAVVRYDAFGDMGGRLSFSCALVDDEGDGPRPLLDPRPGRVPDLRQGHRRWCQRGHAQPGGAAGARRRAGRRGARR